MSRVLGTFVIVAITPQTFRVFSEGGIDGTLLMLAITPETLGVFSKRRIDGSRDKLDFGNDWNCEGYESVSAQSSYVPRGARSDTRRTEYMSRGHSRSGHRPLDLGRKRRS